MFLLKENYTAAIIIIIIFLYSLDNVWAVICKCIQVRNAVHIQ